MSEPLRQRFGRVIDDHIYACGILERPYIPALPADDPAFHLIIINMENRDCVLYCMLNSSALNRFDNNLFGFLVGS